MAVHLRRPSDADLDRLLARCSDDHVTYAPVGMSLGGGVPAKLTRRTWATTLPAPGAFERAVEAMRRWGIQTGSGLTVRADGPLEVGTNLAVIAPLPVGYVDVTCRVVALVDEPDRFGFAYGTLTVHPAQGEESFILSRVGGGVRFEVTAVSRPAFAVAQLVPWVNNRLQAAATGRYLRAMEQLTAVP